MTRIVATIMITAALAGCSQMPRGAALQSEILNVSGDATDAESVASNFQVAPVTRETLTAYADWPRVGGSVLPWIDRVRQPTNRLIHAGDKVSITIWDANDSGLLTNPGQRFVALPNLEVSSTGRVFLPYVGDVRIAGMGLDHARETLEDRFGAISPSAQVQLTHEPGRESSVSLVGGVHTPGVYPMPSQDYTLLDLLADGRGIRASLENGQIRLHRGDRIYGLGVQELYDNPARNTTLRGGDQVIITSNDKRFMSLGAAGRESLHSFPKSHLTAIEAISIAGGVSDSRADPGGVLVLRIYPASAVKPGGPEEQRVVFTIDLTSADGLFSAQQFEIMPNDLIYVTEAPLRQAQSIASVIGSAFGLIDSARDTF